MNYKTSTEKHLEFLERFHDWESIYRSIAEISKQGTEAVPALINRLNKKSLSYYILLTLFLIRDKRAVPHIIDWLENSSPVNVQKMGMTQPIVYVGLKEVTAACYTLGAFGDSTAIPSLINLLKQYGGNKLVSDRYCLKAAADALVKIGKASVQPLIELLKSKHFETRKYAAYALGKIGDNRALPTLMEIVQSQHGLLRETACRALLQIDTKKATEIIQANSLTPKEDINSHFKLDQDLETIYWYYDSLDKLGPLSEHTLSKELYNYYMEWGGNYFYEDVIKGKSEFEEIFLVKGFPKETINELVKIVYLPPLCLCGEYLEWKYVNSPSREYYYDEEGEYLKDMICIYCNNCKRYSGLERTVKTQYPLENRRLYWFYLLRFPNQTELINQEQLEKKTWVEYERCKPEE